MVRCPGCSHECAETSRYCASCAAALDATSAETVVLGASAATVPRLSATSSVDEGRFLPGTVVAARYRIAGLLGRGGMGEVYRATDLTLGQAVALKFLPEATASDDRALARIPDEKRVFLTTNRRAWPQRRWFTSLGVRCASGKEATYR